MPKLKKRRIAAVEGSASSDPEVCAITLRVPAVSAALQKYRVKLLNEAGSPHKLHQDISLELGPFKFRRSRAFRAGSSQGGDNGPPPGWDAKCWKNFLKMTGGGGGAFNPVAAASLEPAVPKEVHKAFSCIVPTLEETELDGMQAMQLVRIALNVQKDSESGDESSRQRAHLFVVDALEEVEEALRLALAHKRRSEPLSELHQAVHVLPAVLSASDCATAISQAEQHAADTGGWTTMRHKEYPTTDVCTSSIPSLHKKLQDVVNTKILPPLASKFCLELPRLSIHDMFIAKYAKPTKPKQTRRSKFQETLAKKKKRASENMDTTESATATEGIGAAVQSGLEEHEDGTPFSFVVALNDLSEFEGGGTQFVKLKNQPTFRVPRGDACAFSGYNRHCGVPVTSGKRYILAGFLAYDEL